MTMPEPLRGPCLSFSFAEEQATMVGYRQLISVFEPAMFRNSSCNCDATGPVEEAARHGRLQSTNSVSRMDHPGQTDRPVQDARV